MVFWNFAPLLGITTFFLTIWSSCVPVIVHGGLKILVFLVIAIAAGKDDYVYDLYAVKDDTSMMLEDALNPFPL